MEEKHYESVVILNAALEDPQIEQTITSVKDNFESSGGVITDFEDWGRKRLAYAIYNSKSGYYLVIRFTSPTSAIKEIERNLKLDENVIRYMTISLDKRDLEYIEKSKHAKEETAAPVVEAETQEIKND